MKPPPNSQVKPMNDFFEGIFASNIPIMFLLLALMVWSALVCVYGGLIYSLLWGIKKAFFKRMSVRARYFSWYLLLLSLPLAGAGWNEPIKVAFYACLTSVGRWQIICKAVVILWTVVVAVKLIRQTVLTVRVSQLMKGLPAYRGSLKNKAAATVGLKPKRLKILVAGFVTSPVSYGVFTKKILLPEDYQKRYSSEELYTLLLHEMVHIKNRDTVKLFFMGFAGCFLWALPLFRKAFSRDTELLCDNRVLGLNLSCRNSYGDLLVKECANGGGTRGIAFSDSYNTLKYRLEGLFRYKPEKGKGAAWAIIVALIPVVTMVFSYWQPASWLIFDEGYNRQFEVLIEHDNPGHNEIIYTNAIELLSLPEVYADGEMVEKCTYEFEQSPKYKQLQQAFWLSGRDLHIDIKALKEILNPLFEEGVIMNVVFRSPNMVIDTCSAPVEWLQWQNSSYKDYIVPAELFTDTEEGSYIVSLEERGLEENLYLLAARWL